MDTPLFTGGSSWKEVRMLVFISDLHFVDETAGKHNVPANAFKMVFRNLASHAERAKSKEVKLVLLGDIFDLLRTERWFGVPLDERPWGDKKAKMEKKTTEIFDEIATKNKDTFELFRNMKDLFKSMDSDIIYIPGNHDRLCAEIPDLKKRIIKHLNLNTNNSSNFKHSYENVDYGVFGRHGHEFDKFNYEGGRKYKDEDYSGIPIGDPITTELIARLPYVLIQRVREEGNLSPEEQDTLQRNFQEIENVRPFSATLAWLLYRVREDRRLKEQIEDSVDQVIDYFNDIPFVEKWYERHDKWYNPFDEADKIQSALYFLEKFKVFSTEKLLELLGKIKKLSAKDELLEGAKTDLSYLDNRIQYVVYGHTHEPIKSPLRVRTVHSKIQQQVYLNTGTWRKRHYECKDSEDFISWKEITYLIFYTNKEKPNELDLPVFETWTGSLKRDEVDN